MIPRKNRTNLNKASAKLRVGAALTAAVSAFAVLGAAAPAHAIKRVNGFNCAKDTIPFIGKFKYFSLAKSTPRGDVTLCFADKGTDWQVNYDITSWRSGNNSGRFTYTTPSGKLGLKIFKKNEVGLLKARVGVVTID